MPKVSVVMPVYNSEAFLGEAIESILSQTFTDFEFVIVDDGSTDRSSHIITDYASKDPRIRVHEMPQNSGIVAALNEGVRVAAAPLIARMDADDISLPGRLERQVSFLDQNPVGLVGSNYIKSTENSRKTTHHPTAPEEVARKLLYACCIGHPTVMFTRDAFVQAGGYEPSYTGGGAEDYDLWLRMSRNVQLANLPDNLLKYRRHSVSLTATASRKDKYAKNSACAVANHFAFLNGISSVSPSDDIGTIARSLLSSLEKSSDTWHKKCLKRWVIRFTRYCVDSDALRSEVKDRLFPHASLKEKLKWVLYRWV